MAVESPRSPTAGGILRRCVPRMQRSLFSSTGRLFHCDAERRRLRFPVTAWSVDFPRPSGPAKMAKTRNWNRTASRRSGGASRARVCSAYAYRMGGTCWLLPEDGRCEDNRELELESDRACRKANPSFSSGYQGRGGKRKSRRLPFFVESGRCQPIESTGPLSISGGGVYYIEDVGIQGNAEHPQYFALRFAG